MGKPASLKLIAGAVMATCCFQSAWAQDNDQVGQLLDEYCTKCHNFDDYAGGIDLEGIGAHNIAEFAEIGEKVIKRLRSGMMPPQGEDRPETKTRRSFHGVMGFSC